MTSQALTGHWGWPASDWLSGPAG